MSRVSFYTRPYDRLEPYDGKLSRTVLRGGAGSNASLLPDIHSEKDVLKLVNTLIANTKGEGEKSAEDFWVKSERLFYTALIGYIWYEAPAEEMNFTTLLEMINASEAREDDPEFQSPVDLMFERLEKKDPDHFAVRQYKKFLLSAGKTRSSILISCSFHSATVLPERCIPPHALPRFAPAVIHPSDSRSCTNFRPVFAEVSGHCR